MISLSTLRLLLQSAEPLVLVSIAAIRGSTPREAGAFMVVSAGDVAGTIGGGNLEHQATARARGILQHPDAPLVEQVRYPLGPTLGQCCGGSVDVAFHVLDPAQKRDVLAALDAAASGNRWMALSLDGRGAILSGTEISAQCAASFGLLRGGITQIAGRDVLALRLDAAATPLWLFGAGHVGQAIVRALEVLPFDIHWVDSRPDYLAGRDDVNVQFHNSPDPWEEVADIPSGAMVLILTHSHMQDYDICRAALRRDDIGFVGMIGSQTKRARFIRRLQDRGLGDGQIARLTCPIGLPGITGKQPAIIAASVAVQLLAVRENLMAQGGAVMLNGRVYKGETGCV
ncbi:xanthine dehydrogenase accessory protein XdhC [Thalassospira sp.]|uniref:xanthine dehydrogenase accessory protein XdhC n=1 Tax=Thalassospira sp. TaxID=1912094 RepID=UPI002732A7A5|nr:xanthine dehydrogenase accessory protein XdhC [Thalassospira sp.]MDP2698943.1 xanthine dehydrogenase accessory protein XdhC [Thalassospira sp.]